jgi:hypothetical protein
VSGSPIAFRGSLDRHRSLLSARTLGEREYWLTVVEYGARMPAADCDRCAATTRMDHWRFCPACGLRLGVAPRQPGVRVQAGWAALCWQCGYEHHNGRCGPDRAGALPPGR